MRSVLNSKPTELTPEFLARYANQFDVGDPKQALQELKDNAWFERLTERWYQDLECSIPQAYTVYDHEKYYQDVWNCFIGYSRRYLRDLRNKPVVNDKTFREYIDYPRAVVDLGCGIGYSTLGLAEIFPDSAIYGTNLMDTRQWNFCKRLFKDQPNIELVGSAFEAHQQTPVDIIFASEYFEHIYDCYAHIEDLALHVRPKYFVLANAFNTHSIGHFTEYDYFDEKVIPQKKASRLFNETLVKCGYVKMKTTFFNNKPTIWERND